MESVGVELSVAMLVVEPDECGLDRGLECSIENEDSDGFDGFWVETSCFDRRVVRFLTSFDDE